MRKKTIILFLTMGALMLSGCNTKIGNTTQQTTESSTTTSSSVTETDTSDMFSDRDKEVGYDESESVTISLVFGFLFSNDHTKIPIAATIISMDTM